ncbi:uncharacterized protein EV420DRAFT_1477015 [Desarmillaria tabescens]|uniref:Uncharacterized protein n=1 Tax=Armillaria tabescens TaxID=1929756 RepID=A0AA39NAY4_ARMTA|nr:uncharacterized protein EV420DRAFT_1477015 [Desarmillaria tabescens]KAK0462264.1 hypothetical protein EV420DRAFT_1477015 [Desarmillaria tabescens]
MYVDVEVNGKEKKTAGTIHIFFNASLCSSGINEHAFLILLPLGINAQDQDTNVEIYWFVLSSFSVSDFLSLSFIINPLPTPSDAKTNANGGRHHLGARWESRNDGMGHRSYAEQGSTSSYAVVARIPGGLVLLAVEVTELEYIYIHESINYGLWRRKRTCAATPSSTFVSD